jgi:hypothetical protein
MKRARAIGICVIAVVGIGAINAAGAAAFSPPELGRCVKVAAKTGKFSSATCVKEKAGGSYEWEPGAVKNKFKTTAGVGALETVNGTTVGCNHEESGGEFNSPKTVSGVVVRFTECHSVGLICTSPGAAEGEIVTHELEGKAGFENKAKKKLALDLFPVAADKGLYVTFNCGVSLSISVGGSVLVPISPVDKMLTKDTLKYAATKGHQKPEHFEGEPNDILETTINTKEPEQSGISVTVTGTDEEPLEVNAAF